MLDLVALRGSGEALSNEGAACDIRQVMHNTVYAGILHNRSTLYWLMLVLIDGYTPSIPRVNQAFFMKKAARESRLLLLGSTDNTMQTTTHQKYTNTPAK